MRLALFLLFAACSGGTDTPSVPDLSDDLDAALDRIEALEAEVATLRASTGTAEEVDADDDGFRDSDGLPMGTKPGDIFLTLDCAADETATVTLPPGLTGVPSPERPEPRVVMWDTRPEGAQLAATSWATMDEDGTKNCAFLNTEAVYTWQAR